MNKEEMERLADDASQLFTILDTAIMSFAVGKSGAAVVMACAMLMGKAEYYAEEAMEKAGANLDGLANLVNMAKSIGRKDALDAAASEQAADLAKQWLKDAAN